MVLNGATARIAYKNRLKAWANGRRFVLGFDRIRGERGDLFCEACGSKRPTILDVIFEVLSPDTPVALGELPPIKHCNPQPIFVGSCCRNVLKDLGILKTQNRGGYDFPLEGIREIWKEKYAISSNH